MRYELCDEKFIISVAVVMELIQKKFKTKYGKIHLTIPRDRNGDFSPALIPAYGQPDDYL